LVIGCWSQGGSPRTMRCCQSLYSIALPPFVYMYILDAFSKARPSYRGPGDDVQKTSIRIYIREHQLLFDHLRAHKGLWRK